jgi:acetyl esterase/lipase
VFSIHGGGFVMETGRDRNSLLMAAELRIPVYSVDYTLAPEAAYPTELNECFAVCRDPMLSNAVRLPLGAPRNRSPVELLIKDGMWHGYQWEPGLPNAVQTRTAATAFARTHLRQHQGHTS